ncbi:MAG: acylphosphatase [Gemmatimonadota bacterium]|nr:acylphosphatase [Gemmatimonadota bacterium]
MEETGTIRAGFRITGRVQGVGFRWWTVRTATSLDLRGTVRNRRDGSVEVLAAGPPDAMERLEEALRRGPPAARVDAVQRRTLDAADPGFTPPPDFRAIR